MREDVQDYYGKQLHSSADLQTNACCDQAPPCLLYTSDAADEE